MGDEHETQILDVMDRYEYEAVLGIFSWLVVPLLILWALAVAAGIGTISFAKLLDMIFNAIYPGESGGS